MKKIDAQDRFMIEMMKRDKEDLIEEMVDLRVENQKLRWQLEKLEDIQTKDSLVWEK